MLVCMLFGCSMLSHFGYLKTHLKMKLELSQQIESDSAADQKKTDQLFICWHLRNMYILQRIKLLQELYMNAWFLFCLVVQC